MDEVLDLVSQIPTLLSVVDVVIVEPVILGLVLELVRSFQWVGLPYESLLPNMEEDLHPR